MKPIALIIFLTAGVCLLSFAHKDVQAEASYSLKTVEANPIPKTEHFLLWKEVALKACSESKTRFNLAESECQLVIGKRANSCASQLSGESPELISTTTVAKDIGRKYLQCAMPFYFCNGVEVKTEQEARAKCK